MVSTRGVKIKFAEGEKVLCYEPDPAKTKVLYDSKVLNIESKRDKHGKNVFHFLIHFQGWSSSWDRVVTEDLILKDTEENRQLQKELAAKAQLIARGGNLYRRERKSRRRSGGTQRRSVSLSNGGSMSQQSESEASDTEETRPVILLPLPEALKRVLEYDELAITTHNKVLNLPAEPNIVSILESFLKEYAQKLMKQVSAKKPQPGKSNSNVMTVDAYCRSMNLCREVVDGIRIFVDFTLTQVLLYRLERGQLHAAMTSGIGREDKFIPNLKIKEEEDDGFDTYPSSNKRILLDSSAASSIELDRRRTLRSRQSASGSSQSFESTRHSRRHSSDHNHKLSPDHNGSILMKSETVRPMSQREHDVLDKILSWNLVPDRVKQAKPPHASVLYGATHLIRALLRLPELMQKSDYSEAKLNLVMDLLNSILKYLEDHPEWFGEYQYRENIYPPPPPELTSDPSRQD